MKNNDIFRSKHENLVSVLITELESKSRKDVLRSEKGWFPVFFKAGLENSEHAIENFNKLYRKLEDIKKNELFTDRDLKIAALYAGDTAIEIKKSSLFDALGPVLLGFWVTLFGSFTVLLMTHVTNESKVFIFLFTAILGVIAAGFRALIARRRSNSIKRALCYSQVEKFIKSLL